MDENEAGKFKWIVSSHKQFTFGTYPKSKSGKKFKKEPIVWDVLKNENGIITAISHYILDCQIYHHSSNNNYASSSIRKWLNNEFLNTAFTSEQRDMILTTNVDNSASSTGNSTNKYACENTNDKIFLLSYQEAKKWFSETNTRMKYATDYAKAQGVATYLYGREGDYWLRSPDAALSHCACHIDFFGCFDTYCVFDSGFGVAPALRIKI